MKNRFAILFSSIMLFVSLAAAQNLAVDETHQVPINGLPQTIMVRGEDSTNPVLLVLHGGPGFSEAMFFRSYNKALERYYTVVHWDQRGANLSYQDSIPPETMNIPQFVSDAKLVVDYLKLRFNKEKIFILGHLWGTVIGLNLVNQHPEEFYAYISIGQLVNGLQNEKQSLDYTIKKARKEKNVLALNELARVAENYPRAEVDDMQHLLVQREWLLKLGGVFYGDMTYASLFRNANQEEAHLYDPVRSSKGERISLKLLWREILQVDFSRTVTELKIPVYFLVGDSDYNTPHALTEQYYQSLLAPEKRLVRFRRSGHFVPFEEPEKFHRVMRKVRNTAKVKP